MITTMILESPAMERVKKLREALGEIKIGIDAKEHRARIDYALSLGFHSMAHLTNKCEGERIAVVGSGPSLAQSLPHLKQFKGKILAVNGAHDYLIANGIKPTFGVLLDPHDFVATYQTPTEGVVYLTGSTVHAKVWQRFLESGIKPWMFVPILTDNEHQEIFEKYADELCFVAGATTVGLRALNIVMHLGASVAECHGFDSCYAPGNNGLLPIASQLHAHFKPHVHHDSRIDTITSRVTGEQFRFVTNYAMSRQIIGFDGFIDDLPTHESHGRIGKFRVVMAGDGAIPWMAWKDGGSDKYIEHLNPEVMAAKYGASKNWDYYLNQPFKLEQAA